MIMAISSKCFRFTSIAHSLLLMGIFFFSTTSSQATANPDNISHKPKLRISAISASPAVLPYPFPPPSSRKSSSASTSSLSSEPPAISPDISPLLPTPAKRPVSPKSPSPSLSSVSSDLPIIPSSPSPPNSESAAVSNPDQPQLGSIPPTGSMPSDASNSVAQSTTGWLLILSLLVLRMAAAEFGENNAIW